MMPTTKPFSELTKDWSPERKAESAKRVAEMSAEIEAARLARQPKEQPTNFDLLLKIYDLETQNGELRSRLDALQQLLVQQHDLLQSIVATQGHTRLEYDHTQAQLQELREEAQK